MSHATTSAWVKKQSTGVSKIRVLRLSPAQRSTFRPGEDYAECSEGVEQSRGLETRIMGPAELATAYPGELQEQETVYFTTWAPHPKFGSHDHWKPDTTSITDAYKGRIDALDTSTSG
jgi:hypothetical protein